MRNRGKLTDRRITCDLPGFATLAQEQLDRALDARTGSDVTRVIQKLSRVQDDLEFRRPDIGLAQVGEVDLLDLRCSPFLNFLDLSVHVPSRF